MPSLKDSAFAIAEQVCEVQAILRDEKHSRIMRDVAFARIRALMSEERLMRALYEIGKMPPETPLGNIGASKGAAN